MKKTIISTNQLGQQITTQIEQYYEQLKHILTEQVSYKQTINIKELKQYLAFVDYALEQPANKIMHIDCFITDYEGLLTRKMVPFVYLTEKAIQDIGAIAKQTVTLTKCWEILYGNNEKHIEIALHREPHEID